MSLCASRRLGDRVWCWSIWSDFGMGSDCLSHPPRLALTLVPESWRAPLVSSCVAREIHRQSKGQEGGHGAAEVPGRGFSNHWFPPPTPPSLFPLSFRQNLAVEKTTFFMGKHKHVFSTSVCCMGEEENRRKKIIKPETHFSFCDWQGLWLENQYCLISLYGQPMSGGDKTLRSVKPHNCNVFQSFGIMSKKWWEPATVHSCSLIFMNNCLLWMLAIPLTFISLPRRFPKCLRAYGLNNTRGRRAAPP